jgi:peptide/nickel transport system substrate-binding protein
VSRRLSIVATAAALLALSTACSSNSGGNDDTGTQEKLTEAALSDSDTCTKGKVGGSANFGAYVDGAGLDPAAPQSNQGGMQQAAIFGTLMRYNYDTAEYEPSIAKSLESNQDKTEWTLTLPDDVTFGDGTPMTAESVKASLERFLEPANASNFTAMVALIKAMDVVDDQTLKLTLSVPWGSFPYIFSAEPGMVVNTAAVKQAGKNFALAPPSSAGAGPYTVARYKPGEQLVLKAKDDWWAGPVCIQDLTMTVTVDGKTKLDSFNADQLNGFITFDAPVAKQVQDSDDKFFVIPNPVISNVQVLATKGAPLADPKLRQALQQAMDLDSINQRIYAGVGVPTSALVDPTSPVAPDVEPLKYDPEAAKNLVTDAKGSGATTAFTYDLNAAPLQTDLSILQEAFWKNAGYDVTRKELQNADLITKVYIERSYDAAQWGMGADPACLWCSLSTWRSDDPTNISGFSSKDMDAALDTLRAASSPEDIKAAMDTVQTVWNEEMPSPISGYLRWVVPVQKLHGLVFNSGTTIQFDKAYVDQ